MAHKYLDSQTRQLVISEHPLRKGLRVFFSDPNYTVHTGTIEEMLEQTHTDPIHGKLPLIRLENIQRVGTTLVRRNLPTYAN